MVTPSQFEFLRSIDTPTVCNLLEIVAPERRGFGYVFQEGRLFPHLSVRENVAFGLKLKRLARRASLGLARTGSTSGNGSGDIFIAFSVANPDAGRNAGVAEVSMLGLERMSAVFDATVQATEEAIVNALKT